MSRPPYVQAPAAIGLIGAIAFCSFLIELVRLNQRTARTLQPGDRDRGLELSGRAAMSAACIVLLVKGGFERSLMA